MAKKSRCENYEPARIVEVWETLNPALRHISGIDLGRVGAGVATKNKRKARI
jgi:hypothetical protein